METSKPVDKLTHRQSSGKIQLSQEDAQAMAIRALTFLADDTERLERFLSLSGLTPATLRTATASPDFFLALLDHIASDEALLLAFCAAAALDPRGITRAREILGGPQPEWSA